MSLRVCRTVAVVSFALVGLNALSVSAEEEPKVVATVNGQPIFGQQLTDELLLRWGEMGLESFIQEIAIEQAAAEAGIEVSDKELEKHALEVQRSIDMRAPETGQSFTLWLATVVWTDAVPPGHLKLAGHAIVRLPVASCVNRIFTV